MISEILRGALISASLIIAIGAQNLFVLKQGLLRNHIFYVSGICFICDFVLMSIGILGVGTFISTNPLITNILAILGALFYFGMALRRLKVQLKVPVVCKFNLKTQMTTV